MYKFTSLLPEKDRKLFNECYNDYGFKRTFDEVARRYDIIDLAKKANEKRDEIQRNNFIHSTWKTFDGEYFNTKEVDSDGWPIRKYREPIYSVRSEWVENMCDALFDIEAKNIPVKNGFSGIAQIRKFRKLINPISEENRTRSVVVMGTYNEKKTFIALSLPCDYIFDNWWMRLFYEIRSLEHLNEYKSRFVNSRWTERIAYTLYIYRFRYPLHMWRVAQKYVKKRFCGKGAIVSKREKIIRERRESIRERRESISTTSTRAEEQKAYVPTPDEMQRDVANMLDINDAPNVESRKPMSVNSESSSEDSIEREGAEALFGNMNNCSNLVEQNIQMSIQRAPAISVEKKDKEEKLEIPDMVKVVSVGGMMNRKPMSISSESSSDDE